MNTARDLFNSVIGSVGQVSPVENDNQRDHQTAPAPIDEEPVVIAPLNVKLANEYADARMSITDSKKAVIYCRVSTPHQATLDQQERDCRKYCEELGYEVISVVGEVGSAYKNGKQNKLHEILETYSDIRLVVFKLCRFSRNTSMCDYFIETLNEKNINLECTTDAVNLTSCFGKLKFREAINLAQFESDQISERVRANIKFKNANAASSPLSDARPALPTTPRTPRSQKSRASRKARASPIARVSATAKVSSPRSSFGFRVSEDRQTLVRNLKEYALTRFIFNVHNQVKDSAQINYLMRRLLTDLERGNEEFEPFQVLDKEDNFVPDEGKIKLTAEVISDLFNLYNIEKRGTPWTKSKVNHVLKDACPIPDLSSLGL